MNTASISADYTKKEKNIIERTVRIIKAYKVRCFPTEEQKQLIVKTFGCCRWYWNQALSDNIKYYEENKKGKLNTPAFYKKEFEWLKEVDGQALCFTQMDLQSAFTNFFKQPSKGFPKFKSKKFPKNSYKTMTAKGFVVDDNTIKLPKLGKVKIVNHRHIIGIAKSCTISMTPTDEFYISVLWKDNEENNTLVKTNKEIGIDLGLTDLAICSDGEKFPILQSLRKNLSKLKKEQRKLSKMSRGSNNYNIQKMKIAKLHQHIANQRKDYLHKISYKLTNENQIICLEDLNVKGMMKNHHLALSVADVGWSMFTDMLEYKAENKGRTVVKIDRWFPSSQICSCCGCVSGKKPLHIRQWTCSECGEKHDRDVNAAKNILTEGKKILGAGSSPDR